MIKKPKYLYVFIGIAVLLVSVGLFRFRGLIEAKDPYQLNSISEGSLVFLQDNTLSSRASSFAIEKKEEEDSSKTEPKKTKQIRVIITAYSSTPEETDSTPFITASGERVREGIIANNLLPFGTKVRIPELFGDKIFVVEDRMNAKKGYYHVDIWYPSYHEAKNFGSQLTDIEVLES